MCMLRTVARSEALSTARSLTTRLSNALAALPVASPSVFAVSFQVSLAKSFAQKSLPKNAVKCYLTRPLGDGLELAPCSAPGTSLYSDPLAWNQHGRNQDNGGGQVARSKSRGPMPSYYCHPKATVCVYSGRHRPKGSLIGWAYH
jgi:hypothetical protein